MPSRFMPDPPADGNAEFHDVDNTPVEMPRSMFVRMRTVFADFLTLLSVKMADGTPTEKFCMKCIRFPQQAHETEPPTCSCACHTARLMLAQMMEM